jgi:hypothetical protein
VQLTKVLSSCGEYEFQEDEFAKTIQRHTDSGLALIEKLKSLPAPDLARILEDGIPAPPPVYNLDTGAGGGDASGVATAAPALAAVAGTGVAAAPVMGPAQPEALTIDPDVTLPPDAADEGETYAEGDTPVTLPPGASERAEAFAEGEDMLTSPTPCDKDNFGMLVSPLKPRHPNME